MCDIDVDVQGPDPVGVPAQIAESAPLIQAGAVDTQVSPESIGKMTTETKNDVLVPATKPDAAMASLLKGIPKTAHIPRGNE